VHRVHYKFYIINFYDGRTTQTHNDNRVEFFSNLYSLSVNLLYCGACFAIGLTHLCLTRNILGSFCSVCLFSSGSRARRSFMQLLWLCCTWIVWQEWNSRIFKAKESTISQLLKAHNANIGINSHMWWSSPLICLGID
jgi:hypothetical protein